MAIEIDDFRVTPGSHRKLTEAPTVVAPLYDSKEAYRKALTKHVKKLSKLQYALYASNESALLIIFQAMDAAGKDGVIKHVMSGVNPQGCRVYSFKHPSATELEHDFLWRTSQCLPERGQIGIFNRSYYEEVLVVRVHPQILAGEGVPDGRVHEDVWHERFQSIVDHERHLYRNGTRVVKFFLHISREEQKRRFIDRIDSPEKNWKFSIDDLTERKFWPEYMKAYEDCIRATSTEHAPWYVVPADDKKNARLIVSEVIIATLKDIHEGFGETTPARRAELESIRDQLNLEVS